VQRLKRYQDNAWIKYILSFSLGVGAGVIVDHLFFKPPTNSALPLNFKYGKNIGYNAIPNQQDVMIQPDIYNGVANETNTSIPPDSDVQEHSIIIT